MEEAYTVYGIADKKTFTLYYIGQTTDYIRRFREHLNRWKVQDLINQGLDLCPFPLYETPDLLLSLNYERRWIFHALQTRQPIINKEADNTSLVMYLQRHPEIDFINLPDKFWLYIPQGTHSYLREPVHLVYDRSPFIEMQKCPECQRLKEAMKIAATNASRDIILPEYPPIETPEKTAYLKACERYYKHVHTHYSR